MNVSATLNAFKLLVKPSICIPHATVPTFDGINLPTSKFLAGANGGHEPDIRAVVLDKDNCFAKPKENFVYKPYIESLQSLRKSFPGSRLLIVSNSAGTKDDPGGHEAKLLKDATGIEVFRHSTKKPGCGIDVFNHLSGDPTTGIERPGQIVVIGDRIFTDVMMANMMGAWSIWVKDGVVSNDGAVIFAVGKGIAQYSGSPGLPCSGTLEDPSINPQEQLAISSDGTDQSGVDPIAERTLMRCSSISTVMMIFIKEIPPSSVRTFTADSSTRIQRPMEILLFRSEDFDMPLEESLERERWPLIVASYIHSTRNRSPTLVAEYGGPERRTGQFL